MSPIWLGPSAVAPAKVRRLSGDGAEDGLPVQRVTVPVVPAVHAVPRQVDPVGRRLLSLQRENAELRAEIAQLRSA